MTNENQATTRAFKCKKEGCKSDEWYEVCMTTFIYQTGHDGQPVLAETLRDHNCKVFCNECETEQ